MTPEARRQQILREMETITRMERGKLCTQSTGPGREPFHKLQCWHQGKNQTRYVPAAEVPELKEALAGHARFQQLAEEFVEVTIGMTQAAADSKKNFRKSRKNATGKPKRS